MMDALPVDQIAGLCPVMYVTTRARSGSHPIALPGKSISILVDKDDWPGVLRAASSLRQDLSDVTGSEVKVVTEQAHKGDLVIILGSINRSPLLQHLEAAKKVSFGSIRGKWESTLSQAVASPLPGIDRALVIAGSDKRGAIYGAYDLSEQIGVSPWRWWADVPVRRRQSLFVKPGSHLVAAPVVRYRGVFLNDEAPCLSNWAHEKFGGYNHRFYEKVFELLLRLRGNYLWPAMWNNCFYQDDPRNGALADEFGIVMGTSHVEPMMRADKEWNRLGKGEKEWNFATHSSELLDFWKEGIGRSRSYETITTIGMRGKIDTPMSEEANIALLEDIVAAQRRLLSQTVNPKVEEVPQLWCLYKEVQEYYEKGMRVPDDVTLLWADDNWGNIRRLPTPEERGRSGGAGVYYHFDYVGGPRNYKWLNTTNIARVREQMDLASQWGANRIWIVNVGDIKPVEFPMEFFLRMAWNPSEPKADGLVQWARRWAEREFGRASAKEIADLMMSYSAINARRKPELLDASTFSLIHYGEWDRVMEEYQRLADRAVAAGKKLPDGLQDAYRQLVLHPILACSNLYELYWAVAKNHQAAREGRISTKEWAERARRCFRRDEELTREYHAMAGGKWSHMMSQTHIGYETWQQPEVQKLPKLFEKPAEEGRGMGVALEGGGRFLPPISDVAPRRRWIDLYRREDTKISFTATASEKWIKIFPAKGSLERDERLWIEVDRKRAPRHAATAEITIRSSSGQTLIYGFQYRPAPAGARGFLEVDKVISIGASHYDHKTESDDARWMLLPGIGRDGDGMGMTPLSEPPGPENRLEFDFTSTSYGPVVIHVMCSPTQLLKPGPGLRYAISIDGDDPQTVNVHDGLVYFTPSWEKTVADNVNTTQTVHVIAKPGRHTLKLWALDAGVVFQKVVLNFGGLKPSYLGPPESPRITPP